MVTAFQVVGNKFLHFSKRAKKLGKTLERWGDCVFDRGESQEWLNEDLKNYRPFPKDGCVSCLSDTGLVSLPESSGGNRDFGERASSVV